MIKKECYYNIDIDGNIKYDAIATWINNSRWSWIVVVVCLLLVAFVEAL